MPVCSDGISSIVDGAVRKSLQPGNHLSQRVTAASQRVLLHRISFCLAEQSGESQLASMRLKYPPLNASSSSATAALSVNKTPLKQANGTGSSNGADVAENKLPSPRVVLFSADRLHANWSAKWRRVGGGLRNMGNTCYMNAVLQCLTYTAPLHSFVCANEHYNGYQQGCMTCAVQTHAKGCLDLPGSVITPYTILKQLQVITHRFHFGRQEDAHECLRTIMSAMQASCLKGSPKLDKVSQLTTAVHQIFGGHLQSQVICLRCKARSTIYEPFLDLSVDVVKASSVPEAMEQFTRIEKLDGDNAYYCAKCHQKVPAHKLLAVHATARVLTVHLKRFNTHNGKVNRHIRFFARMDIRPYMGVKKGDPVLYDLYAVLVHQGSTTYSGHYFAYIKAPDNQWYCMNDAMVMQSSLKEVLNANAYMLFYIRCDMQKAKGVVHTPNGSNAQPRTQCVQTVRPSEQKNSSALSCSDLGVPVDRGSLDLNRPRISFNLNGKTNPEPAAKRPRIVVHIRNGGISRETTAESMKTASKMPTHIVNQQKLDNGNSVSKIECVKKVLESGAAKYMHPAKVENVAQSTMNVDAPANRNSTVCSKIGNGAVVTQNGKTDAKIEGEKEMAKGNAVVKLNGDTNKTQCLTLPITPHSTGNTHEKLSEPCDSANSKLREDRLAQIDAASAEKNSDISTAKSVNDADTCVNSWTVEPLTTSASCNGCNVVSTEWCITNHLGGNGVASTSAVAAGWKVTKQSSAPEQDGEMEQAVAASASSPIVSEHQKDVAKDEKLKKHRHTAQSDEQTKERKRKKRKRKAAAAATAPHSDDEQELVWVEKTLDTISEFTKVPVVHNWDEQFHQGVNKQHSTWNGVRSDNSSVLEQLQNGATQGYGSQVLSWTGCRSALDLQTDADRAEKRANRWLSNCYNDDDDNMDRGKIKKVRKDKCSSEINGSGDNAFQKYQDRMKTGWQQSSHGARASSSSHHGYHHPVHHKRHYNSHKHQHSKRHRH